MKEEFFRKNGGREFSMKRKILSAMVGIAGLVAAYFIVSGISNIIYQRPAESESTQAEGETQEVEPGTEEAKVAMTEDEINEMLAEMKSTETAETEEFIPVKFTELQQVNPDVYAWITVPGTEIDYPILQHASDNSYYLMHNIDGSYGYPGCIYTENLNSKDFTDNNTVIYGHNMKNGSMFAQLHKFEDPDFFNENREVLIYLPDEVLHYTIFAVHIYDDRHLLYSFDFSDPDVYQKYLDSVFSTRDMSANIDKDMTVTKDDRIITLVTCIGSQPNNRLLVQAVLTDREPGVESITTETVVDSTADTAESAN